MQGYIANIEKLTLENRDFRRVLYTAKQQQLVLMSLAAGEEIGEEVHNDTDQFFRIEQGRGQAVLAGVTHELADGSVVIVPAGTRHNIINTGAELLQLYTLYSPPHHRDGVVHRTKQEAEADPEHFEGETTE